MKSRWIEHYGKRVLLADYSDFGVNAAALQQEIDALLDLLRQEPPHSVLAISNVSGTIATPGTFSALKSVLRVSNDFVRRRAVIGLRPSQMAFLEIINRLTGQVRMKHFATLEEALDWIVQD